MNKQSSHHKTAQADTKGPPKAVLSALQDYGNTRRQAPYVQSDLKGDKSPQAICSKNNASPNSGDATVTNPQRICTEPINRIAVYRDGAGWSSPVARQAHNLKAAGSNPAPATNET
jgi:hypothetical protein